VVVRLWPVPYGVTRILRVIRPPPVRAAQLLTTRLRGFPLQLRFDPRGAQGYFLYYRGVYEERLLRKLRQLLAPGMTFVDVGANIGLYSVVAGHCVGPRGLVLAFEPQAELAPVFWENVRMNRLSNVRHAAIALGRTAGVSSLFRVNDSPGQVSLRLRPDERSVGPAAVVTVRTLSEALREQGVVSVHGMKIDVEGGDLDVLEGFREWLAATPPKFIFCECIDRLLARFGHRSEDLIRFLRGYGYVVYYPSRTRWALLEADAGSVTHDLLALHTSR